jgi:hypothetical protein
MARLKEGKLTATDLASYGILPVQPDETEPAKSQESEPSTERRKSQSHVAEVLRIGDGGFPNRNATLRRLTKSFIQIICRGAEPHPPSNSLGCQYHSAPAMERKDEVVWCPDSV